MGKKAKKGLIGDFSDEEEVEVVAEEETPKKTTKKAAGGKAGESEESNGKKKAAKSKEADEEEEKPKGKKKAVKEESEEKPKTKKKVAKDEEDEDEVESSKSTKKTTKKSKATKEEDSEEEEEAPKPKKQNGGETKKPKKKKGGNWQEYEEEEETKSEPKKEEKGKAQKKKAIVEDDDEEEEEITSKKGKGKAKKDTKAKKAAESDEEEEPEEEPKEKKGEVKAKTAAGGKKGKKAKKTGLVGDFSDEDDEAATPDKDKDKDKDAEDDAGKKDKKKKKKKPTAPKEEAPAASEPAEAKDGGKAADSETKPAPTKPTKAEPKKAAGKAAAKEKENKKMSKALEMLKKQREEQERLEKEAEELRKKEEAEELERLEEERRLAAEERKRKELKKAQKKLNAAPTVSAATQLKNAQNAAFLQNLKDKGLLPKEADTGAGNEKKRSKVYQTKRNKPKKSATDEAPAETPTQAPEETSPTPTDDKQPEAQSQDVVDDWENWEEHVDEVAAKIAVTKIEETPTPSIPAEPTPVTAQGAAPASTPAVAPAQKKDEGKAKPGSKKDKKAPKKGDKKEEPKDQESAETEQAEDESELRSPICCILGHVDTGKTSLLDKIRSTDVQGGEAGGITQQIGATYFPMSAIQEKTHALTSSLTKTLQMKVPGLLVIDTPGHESFTNLRSRGSGLCDIAILVVDIMHALEPQTIESINLLRMRKTPFVVALNKVDRIYGWRSKPFNPFRNSLKLQDKSALMEFEQRTKEVITAFAEHSLNATLYYNNKEFGKYVSLVPTSAHTGEGIPDLLLLLVQLTQKMMAERLRFTKEVQCTVLEVKVVEGLGTTLDVILVNGVLHEGDTIVLCGLNGPIVTTIRAVLAPQPLRELRVKGQYEKLKEIKAAMGVKIVAQDLEKAIAGSSLYVAETPEDIEDLKEEVQADFDSILNSVDSSSRGVCVQASTLGSLEALLTFLKSSKIPVSGVSIGPIHKRDVIRASIMLEHNPEFAVILAFDVKVEKDAQAMADTQGVKIFTADIIYHLFDRFTAYMADLKQKKREAAGDQVVWPCVVRIKPDCIFNKKAPLVLGMEVVSGTLRLGTPLCVPNKNYIDIGVVTGIEKNHKQQQEAKKGDEVAVKIESSPENAKEYGKHFDDQHDVCSRISRESIDLLVSLWGEELSQTDRQLILKLKTVFKIQ